MPKFKASGLAMLRTIFKARGSEVEQRFLGRLTAEEAETFLRVSEESWYPAEMVADCLAAGAEVLYPFDPEGIHRLGWEMALHNLTGAQKVVLRFMSVPDLIDRTAELWANYCDSGQARSVKDPDQKHGFMVVEGYPELTEVLRKTVGGFIEGALSLTGAKHIRVSENARDPNAWRWDVVWE